MGSIQHTSKSFLGSLGCASTHCVIVAAESAIDDHVMSANASRSTITRQRGNDRVSENADAASIMKTLAAA